MFSFSKFLQGFFWFAYAAFLSASIPHVAYFFRSYEPDAPGQDIQWWLVSYALAVSIDVTLFLLSVTVANLHRQRKSAGLICSVWFFIAGLAALSWYINYKYAAHFMHTGMVSPTAVTLPYLGIIPDINPIIASAFQALAIAYTWIADKIAMDAPALTAAQLKEKADELEQAAREQARIKAIQRGGKVSSLTGFIDAAKDVAIHARNATKTARHSQVNNEPDTLAPGTEQGAPETESDETPAARETEPIPQQKDTDKLPRITEPDETVKSLETPGENAGINKPDETKNASSSGATGARSVTIKEAARVLGKSEQYIRTLVNNGKLRAAPRNKKLIVRSSIDAYIAARKTDLIAPSKTAFSLVLDEQENTEQNAAELSA